MISDQFSEREKLYIFSSLLLNVVSCSNKAWLGKVSSTKKKKKKIVILSLSVPKGVRFV
jgi:hypothetical protein